MAEARDTPAPAQPLRPDDSALPDHIRSLLLRAQSHWLKNTEVLSILQEYESCGLTVSSEPPVRPPGGSIFLFDRKAVRFFRKDGHNWRKKSDGKTVRETHEKLKVGNVEMLNCYYAHSERDDGPQRRCYWQLDAENDIVLVHYLVVDKSRAVCGAADPQQPDSARAAGSRQTTKDHDALETGADILPTSVTAPDYVLPSMSMDTFLAVMDEQHTPAQRFKSEEPDAFFDGILPSWEELAASDALPLHESRAWLGGPTSDSLDISQLPSHIIHADGSLRLIEPSDQGYQGASQHETWDEQPLNVLGTRQIPHDARQILRRGPSYGRNGGRLQIQDIFLRQQLCAQDSMYATKTEQLQRAAEALQTADVAIRGAVGSIAGLQGATGDRSRPNGGLPFPEEAQPPLDGLPFLPDAPPTSRHEYSDDPMGLPTQPLRSAYTGSRQPAGGAPGFTAIPELPELRGPPGPPQSLVRPSPFGAHLQHSPMQRAPFPASQPALPERQAFGSPHVAPSGRTGRLAARSISMELPTMTRASSRGVTWRTPSKPDIEAAEDIGGSKARGGTYAAAQALALESDFNRVVQHLRRPSGTLHPEQLEDQVAIDEHLQKLETASTQLLRNKSGPVALPPEMQVSDGADPPDSRDDTSSSMPVLHHDGEAGEDMGPLPFEVLDYTPDWDFTCGGAKLIVTCSFTDQTNLDVTNARLHVMFDQYEVMATVLRPGVIRVYVPPHDSATVDLRLTFGDGRARSCSFPFTYRMTPHLARGPENTLVQASDRELQQRLITMLAGSVSQQSSDQDSAGYSSGSGRPQHSPGQANGLSVRESLGTSHLANLSTQQAERLLVVMIERAVQSFVNEGASQDIPVRRGRIGRGNFLDWLHEGGYGLGHLLAGLGYERALDVLLAAGADPSLQDAWGYTPLHWSAAKGRTEAIALLTARRASLEVLTFLTELSVRMTPADVAQSAGHPGLAAFLGEQHLRQAALALRAHSANSPGSAAGPGLQRKRSRHLPQGSGSDLFIDVSMTDITSSHDEGSPDPTAAGKENIADPEAVISSAKKDFEALKSAMLRKHTRRVARQERKLRLHRMQIEALRRLRENADGLGLPRLLRATPHSHQTDKWRAWYTSLGPRMQSIQQILIDAIEAQCELPGDRQEADALPPPSAAVADYGSDSDVTMSRNQSYSSQRRLKQLHESRRVDARSTQQWTKETSGGDTLSSSDNAVGDATGLGSNSGVLRAISHVELLRLEGAQAQYRQATQSFRTAELAQESPGSFKFARTEHLSVSC